MCSLDISSELTRYSLLNTFSVVNENCWQEVILEKVLQEGQQNVISAHV
jgi:hypothetical protein